MTMTMEMEVQTEIELETEIRRRLTSGEPTLFRELAEVYGFGHRAVQNRIQRVKAQLAAEKAQILPELIGQEVVADYLGVTSQALSNWFSREADSGRDWEMPEPTYIQFNPGKPPRKVWKRAQLPDWGEWYFGLHLPEQGDHIPAKNRRKESA